MIVIELSCIVIFMPYSFIKYCVQLSPKCFSHRLKSVWKANVGLINDFAIRLEKKKKRKM